MMSNKYKIYLTKRSTRAIEPTAIMSNQFVIDVCQIIFGRREARFVAKITHIKSHLKYIVEKKNQYKMNLSFLKT